MNNQEIIGYMDLFVSKLTARQTLINDIYLNKQKIESLKADISSLSHKKRFYEHKKSEGRISDEENSWLNFIPNEIIMLEEKMDNLKRANKILQEKLDN